jgi:ADP-ribosyl-[dinitrogen reductase] hydrolase
MKQPADSVKAAFIGAAIGDALGVPVEFSSRLELKTTPVTGMMGNMMHSQPAGTWSDDSSLIFCTAESLISGYSLDDIAVQFSNWKNNKFWTPHGRVFDIGISTSKGIERIDRFLEMGIHVKPIPSQEVNQNENGNGSLMRMLPLVFFLADKPFQERFRIIHDVSSLTHAHERSIAGCVIYIEFAIKLLQTNDKYLAYHYIQQEIPLLLKGLISSKELNFYDRILIGNIGEQAECSIKSTPYVLYSLEASLWSVMSYNNFTDVVLSAVNLGGDTDTIGSIAGGLAGMIYGLESLPEDWLEALSRKDDIIDLAERFAKSLSDFS